MCWRNKLWWGALLLVLQLYNTTVQADDTGQAEGLLALTMQALARKRLLQHIHVDTSVSQVVVLGTARFVRGLQQ
jgi:hypothetical protein